jgi:energy-coupling factor transporter ATP-binding protein EcfA2
MRIVRLELVEIGPFEKAVLEIPAPDEGQRGELVIFEGPNGSGKTTIAQAIACAAEPFSAWREEALYSPLDSQRRRCRSTQSMQGRHVMTGIEHAGDILTVDAPQLISPGPETLNRPASRLLRSYISLAIGRGVGKLDWAAFAYQGHQQTPVVATRGPAEIETPPLRGALSFGAVEPASAHFGQLLVNLDQEVAKAFRETHREGVAPERRQDLERLAASRQKMLDEIARALSEALARKVTFDVPVGQHAPTILVDGEAIPLALLGEGMRSTLAWLADLLVRLHRIPWEDTQRSPLEQDFWLILDEIDESLHPTMQMRILPALRRLFPNARIYVTTHSPFVVASAGEGYVFSIRPDARHRVSGTIAPRKLEPGQSLEWVVEEIFGAETGFIDPWTRDALRAHRADIARLRRKEAFGDDDWRALLARRAALMRLNEQVQTVVEMQEVPVARAIEARLAGAGA